MTKTLRISTVIAGFGLAVLSTSVARSQGMSDPLPVPVRLTAFAVNMSGVGGGGASSVDIQIDRWSTDEEREGLINVFVEKGPKNLLSALQKTKRIGYMRLPNTIGYDLHYAREFPLDEGGRRIILATDRHIEYWEARNAGRSMDYPFTLVEIRLNKEGEGQGKLSMATKISLNKKDKTIELENWGTEPVRLTTVKIDKK